METPRSPDREPWGIGLSSSFFLLGDGEWPWLRNPKGEEEAPSHWPATPHAAIKDSSKCFGSMPIHCSIDMINIRLTLQFPSPHGGLCRKFAAQYMGV